MLRNTSILLRCIPLLLALQCWAGAGELETIPKPLKVPNAESIRNVQYLPAWRYSGDPGPRRDYELVLDLHLPAGPRQVRPLIMYVHGGAYSAGHKDESYHAELVKVLVDGGFAVGTLNYPLNHRGIFPQVWWDFEEAARFLRVNADKYGLDPNAFGAIGISAGGWLITTSGHADGRTFTRGCNQYASIESLDPKTFAEAKPGKGEESFLRPTLAQTTAYPGVSGRWQALAYDFAMCTDRANGFSPAILQFVGTNRTSPPPTLAAAGVEWTPAILIDPFWIRGVHAPKMTRNGHEGERSITRTLDGKGETQLAEVIRDWFRGVLTGPSARAPVPEIWPATRMVNGPVEVSIVVPDPASVVRYTLDGSEPGPTATRYTKPFTVEPGTRVRAFAELADRRPSRVVEAKFVLAPSLIRITAPLERDLPPAQTGKPYSVRFTADATDARWNMQGDLRLNPKNNIAPNGLKLDESGVLSGTPTTPGTYWVQIWVNQRPGQVATHRDYRLVITGTASETTPASEKAASDDHQQIALLRAWPDEDLNLLNERMQTAKLHPVLQDSGDKNMLLLVPASETQVAREVLARLMRERPKTTAAELTR